jgi:hypothetical protein
MLEDRDMKKYDIKNVSAKLYSFDFDDYTITLKLEKEFFDQFSLRSGEIEMDMGEVAKRIEI